MFNSILLPIDGSGLSNKPLQTAIGLSRTFGARMIVLSVAEPRLFNSTEPNMQGAGRLAEAAYLRLAHQNVEDVVVAAKRANVHCESVVTTSRMPSEEIIKTASRFQCGLIIMEKRGETGLVDLIFGESVTQEVLNNTDIPVLVFP